MQVVHSFKDNTATVELSLSDDGMELFARVSPEPEHILVREATIVAALTSVTPRERLDMRVVREVVRQLKLGRTCEGCRVATGTAPTNGADGKVVWLVRRFNPTELRTVRTPAGEAAREDLHSRTVFENVVRGRELARVYKPTGGTDGATARGEPVPATPGKAATISFDKSITLSAGPAGSEYDLLISSLDGYVHEENGAYSVREQLVVPENLDYAVGHIDFIGSVKVVGDVNKGFHIKARGVIEVCGSVLGDNVLHSAAAVVIKGFHHGGEHGRVRCAGSYTVSVAQAVVTDLNGPVRIEREARDSTLATTDGVFAEQATIVGGRVLCVKGSQLGTVGTTVATTTILELKNEREVTAEYRAISDNIQKHIAAKAALELHIGPFLKNRPRIETLQEQFRKKIVNLLSKYDDVNTSLLQLQAKLHEMQQIEHSSDARINIVKTAHAGTEFRSGDTVLRLTEDVSGPASFQLNSETAAWQQIDYKPFTEETKHGK